MKKGRMTCIRFSISFMIVLTLIYPKDAVSTLKRQHANTCPFNETEWKERSADFFCQGKDIYHCFLAEDKVSVREGCTEMTMLLGGFCPIFTDDGYLHWSACNGTGCPNSSYTSDQVYKYRVCFGDTDSAVTNPSGSSDGEGTPALGLELGIAVCVFLILVIVIYIVYRKLHPPSDETEDIINGTKVLRSENILYVIGRLGNSVSTVGKGIVTDFNSKHHKIIGKDIVSGFVYKRKKTHGYLNYLDISESFEFSEDTAYFVDGWFGLWNHNPCEKSSVIESLRLIIELAKDTEKKTKFVIGLRTDVFDSYKNDLKEIGISFPQRQIILRDSSSKHKDIRVKRHLRKMKRECETNRCPCQALRLEDIKSIDVIGGHLIINLLRLDHTMAPDLVDVRKGPLQTMIEHFRTLESKDKNLFECILYIVLIGFYDEKEFRSDVADQFSISENILKEGTGLDKYTKSLEAHEIAQMWTSKVSGNYRETNDVLVFWHNFLYTCAFHACYGLYPEKIMRHCNLDAILQMVRPRGQKSDFTVEADKELISIFYLERIQGKVFEDVVKDHPLIVFLKTESVM